MSEKVKALLEGKGGNYIFPFFWQHGETEEVLRTYMRVIHEANIGAVSSYIVRVSHADNIREHAERRSRSRKRIWRQRSRLSRI